MTIEHYSRGRKSKKKKTYSKALRESLCRFTGLPVEKAMDLSSAQIRSLCTQRAAARKYLTK